MLAQPFMKPVLVWVGLGFPRQLNTVADAYQFLMELCGNSPEQRAALRACKRHWPAKSTLKLREGSLLHLRGGRTSYSKMRS
jgi:hypothetical protein